MLNNYNPYPVGIAKIRYTTWKVTSGENKNGVSFFGNLDKKIYLRKYYANLFFLFPKSNF
jgi:hypothetical protein